MRCVLLFSFLLLGCQALRILVYIPTLGVSHVTTMGRIADVLAEAGHQVTAVMPQMETLRSNGTRLSHIIPVQPAPETVQWVAAMGKGMDEMAWQDDTTSLFAMLDHVNYLHGMFRAQCNKTIATPGLLDRLRDQNFDFMITEPMDMCALTIANLIGLEKYALALTTTMPDFLALTLGSPLAPSYVPSMMSTATERMSFTERASNLMSSAFMVYFCHQFSAGQDAFNARHEVKRPITEQIARASVVFVNSDPLIEYPRPTLHKIIDIGGISVPPKSDRPLDEYWDSLLSLRPKTVLVSFGSVSKSYLMPMEYKHGLKEMFRRFPNVTFIWKYEKPEHNVAAGIDNVVTSTWVPQQQILGDPRLSLFITHGGSGSTNEAIARGVAVVAIPTIGDQMRNGRLLERIGSGLSLRKEQLANADVLEKTVRRVLHEPQFAASARRTAALLGGKPFSPAALLARHVEFAAAHGPLTQLDPLGRTLPFHVYYMLDVIAAIAALLILTLAGLVYAVRFVVRCCCARKVKND